MARSRASLLNTETTNFLDLVGNGKVYRVPPFQRDYSWGEEQWEDLWTDLMELREGEEQRHYMGAIVVAAQSDREFSVIDGQQRITTLSLLVLAVLWRLKALADADVDAEKNLERMKLLRTRFLGEKDPASLTHTSKLFLNKKDNDFFQTYLLQLREPRNPQRLGASQQLMYQCLTFFRDKLAEIDHFRLSGQKVANFLNEVVARRLLFILITVEDELSAYTVFETLNARGVELSSTDLLKNYLFSQVPSEIDLEQLQRQWEDILSTVGQKKFPEFLRFYLMLKHKQVRQQRLFKIVKQEVRDRVEVFELLEQLELYAEVFSALANPFHEYWTNLPKEVKQSIRELALFRVRQVFPVLMAGYVHLRENEFVRLLKLTVVVSFRYTSISRLNPRELEPVYHDVAKAIKDGKVKTAGEAFERLRAVYVEDKIFKKNFEFLSIPTKGQKKKLIRYILCAIEGEMSGRACDFESDPASIEHILPENPGQEWEENFPPAIQPTFVCRLGNLGLLEKSLNKRCENSSFKAKLDIYCDSKYEMMQKIDGTEWSPTAIEKRQASMAKMAAHVWRFDP
jgi:Protein of unknown function DUF262/Protein of unknown function (DUF1524)